MARLGRPGLSEACRQEVWERWRDGESLSEIARAVGKQPGSIHGLLPVSRTRRTASAFCSAVNFRLGRLLSVTARSLGVTPNLSELSTSWGEGQSRPKSGGRGTSTSLFGVDRA
jgi:hypothetical protein